MIIPSKWWGRHVLVAEESLEAELWFAKVFPEVLNKYFSRLGQGTSCCYSRLILAGGDTWDVYADHRFLLYSEHYWKLILFVLPVWEVP